MQNLTNLDTSVYNKIMVKIGEAAKILNVSVKTLQRWDRDGLLKAKRTPTNHRFYTVEQLDGVRKGKQEGSERKGT